MRSNVISGAFAVALAMLSSCAWNKGELAKFFNRKSSADDGQLAKVGANEEELSKFAVSEAPPSVVEPVVAKKPTVLIPPKPRNLPVKLPTAKPSTEKLADETPAGDGYPADYPEELKLVDQTALESWKLFKPNLNQEEKMLLDVDYLGMTVGKVVLSYRGLKMISAKPVHHFQAYFKSAPFYSAIYEIDDQLDTYVMQESFVGLRSNLVQRESKQNVDEVQLYDREALRTTAYQKQDRKGEIKNRKWEGIIPKWSIDPLSVLWLIRGLPLKDGDRYHLPLVNKGKTLVLEATVEAREVIKTKIGEIPTIRVRAHTQYTGKTLKSGDMTLWFTQDRSHKLVRAKAKIQIGSVFAEVAKE